MTTILIGSFRHASELIAPPSELFAMADSLMREAYQAELEGDSARADKDRAESKRLYQLAVLTLRAQGRA